MFTSLIPPRTKTPPTDDHLEELAQRLFRRVHDETIWDMMGNVGGAAGIRSMCRNAAGMAVCVRFSELPYAYWELLRLSLCLNAVARYCIWVEAPLKASILPRLPRWAAWKAASLYTEIEGTYYAAIELLS